MKDQRTAGLVIIQDGKIRLKKYGLRFSGNGRWTSFSVAKSVTSTLVGAAIKDGYIKSIDDKVSDYIPDLKGSVYDDVTIKQLLTMTSGCRSASGHKMGLQDRRDQFGWGAGQFGDQKELVRLSVGEDLANFWHGAGCKLDTGIHRS